MKQIFISYVRATIEADRVSDFRTQLQNELHLRIPEGAKVFQDSKDIRTGDRWENEIRETLDASSALVVLVSPTWFEREWCVKEARHFRDRHGDSGAVFPVIWVETNEPEKDDAKEMWRWLRSAQGVDWSELRSQGASSPAYHAAVSRLAADIQKRVLSGLKSGKPSRPSPDVSVEPSESRTQYCVSLSLSNGTGSPRSALGIRVGNGVIVTSQDALLEDAVLQPSGSELSLQIDGAPATVRVLWAGGSRNDILVLGDAPSGCALPLEQIHDQALVDGTGCEVAAGSNGGLRMLGARLAAVATNVSLGKPTESQLGIAGLLENSGNGETTSHFPGAPVFVRERWVGVAGKRTVGGSVSLASTSELRHDLRWCAAVGIEAGPEAQRRLRRAQDEVRTRLDTVPEFRDGLLKDQEDQSSPATDPVVVAMSRPARQLIIYAYAFWMTKAQDGETARRLSELLNWLLPWCIDPLDPAMRGRLAGDSTRVIRASELSIAEIVMAGAHERSARFRIGKSPFIGVRALTHAMDEGVDLKGEHLVAKVTNAIHTQFGIARDKVKTVVKGRYDAWVAVPKFGGRPSAPTEESLPFYFACLETDHGPTAIQHLADELPGLGIVIIDGNPAAKERDDTVEVFLSEIQESADEAKRRARD